MLVAGADMWPRVSFQYTREQLLTLRPRALPADPAEFGGGGAGAEGVHSGGLAPGARAAGWESSSEAESSQIGRAHV